jgi:oleate hydratase
MWSTTFAFQTWHSAAELRRYMKRFMHEFLRIHTLEGVARTPYNQYDSIILPIQRWLEEKGVNFEYNAVCDDIEINVNDITKTVTSISVTQDGNNRKINIGCDDIVILQNGSMTDGSGIGTMTKVAKPTPPTSWKLWEKLAKISADFGNPDSFTRSIKESLWYSFTVTINNDRSFIDQEIKFSTNVPGQGALVAFKDSNWLMSIVVPKQPHYRNQPQDYQVFWGYGLFPDRVCNFVHKSMLECTGAEILDELIGHLGFDKSLLKNANCVTCIMPYITSQFMTRHCSDRPLPVPKGCTNLGMSSQFVEIPDDVVFTVEYSVRSAQMAVYQLLNIEKQIPAISHYENEIGVKIKCVKTAFVGSDFEIIFKLIFITILICIAIKIFI